MENRLKESQEHKHTDHLGSSPVRYQVMEAHTSILAMDVATCGQIGILFKGICNKTSVRQDIGSKEKKK